MTFVCLCVACVCVPIVYPRSHRPLTQSLLLVVPSVWISNSCMYVMCAAVCLYHLYYLNTCITCITKVISQCDGVKEVVVYGVTVPGNEGRAGMACIVVDETSETSFKLEALAGWCKTHLPAHARPVFIRVKLCMASQMTSTFKYKKTALVKQRFDPRSMDDGDRLFLMNPRVASIKPNSALVTTPALSHLEITGETKHGRSSPPPVAIDISLDVFQGIESGRMPV